MCEFVLTGDCSCVSLKYEYKFVNIFTQKNDRWFCIGKKRYGFPALLLYEVRTHKLNHYSVYNNVIISTLRAEIVLSSTSI